MKTITEKTLLRIANTRTICAQLPEVFTKSQYEELRRLQAHGLRELWMKETGMRYKSEGYFAKEEGAFKLDNLKAEGFRMRKSPRLFRPGNMAKVTSISRSKWNAIIIA